MCTGLPQFPSLANQTSTLRQQQEQQEGDQFIMASDETTMKTVHLVYDDDEDDDEVCCAAASGLSRLSRLSIETSDGEDADAEMSAADDDERPITVTKNNNGEFFINEGTVSLPGTPDRAGSGPWAKDYASETEARGRGRRRRRRRRRARERWLDRAWEMKRSSGPEQCRVLVRPRGPDSGSICMDMDEVKACRELGLELPCDWTVEIPGGFSGVDTSSGGNSPIGNWRISSPGDNPRDVKARLKVWARAVALASASSLSG